MNPLSATIVVLTFTVLAVAEPEPAGGSGGRQRGSAYGTDINPGRHSIGNLRSQRSPEAAQYGGRGGNAGRFGGGRGGFGGGRSGFGGNSGGFGGSSFARPQQQRGRPYGANTPFGNQQNGGFGRQNGGFGGGRG